MWRFGCGLIAAIALVAVWASIAVGLLASHFGVLPVATFAAFFVLLLMFVTARGMRRITRPMDDLIDAAGRIERGDYSAHVSEYGPSQMRSVARAFNSMSARLKSSDEQRRGFLADVVHELRTPLAVIRGQAEAITDGVYPPDEEHMSTIVDATQSLERLVEDLRALALTDTGSLALHREAVDLAELLRDTAAAFEAQAEAAGVSLTSRADDGLPPLDVDPVRMRGAIGNVIGNAISHTPAGGTVHLSAALAGGGQVGIAVADTGEGIPPDLLPRVFERFVRSPTSSGSGLGLAIAHGIVVAHRGSIEIESNAGTGTTVRITLPAAQPD